MEAHDINGKTYNMSGGSIDVSGIPVMHIFGTLPASKDDGNVKVRYTFTNGIERRNGYATLKVQGNSTARYPKKNYTLKLFSDAACKTKAYLSFADWGEQTKFVMKADWIDISHARNIVSVRLWSDMVASRPGYASLPEKYRKSPNNGVVDGFICRVYVNGVYWGRYSFNIPKDEWMFNMDGDLDTNAALYSEDYSSGCFRNLAVVDESDWTDEIHDSCPANIVARWNEVIGLVMNATDAQFKAGIGSCIDLDSLIDYYIFAYVTCGLDILGKNQMYLTYDGQYFYASAYDLDSTWGLFYNGQYYVSPEYRMQEDYESGKHGNGNLLYLRLEANFPTEIQQRYAALRAGVLSAAYIKDQFKAWCDVSSPELMALDYAPETGNGAFTEMPHAPGGVENNYSQIAAFVDARLAYVDAQIAQLGA